MRLTTLGVPAIIMVTMILAGCSTPSGTDGNLTNGWALPATPTPYTPANNVCYDDATGTTVTDPKPKGEVDCAASHTLETFYVGAFTGAAAELTTLPEEGGTERRTAYEQCMSSAKTFLGDDWRVALLTLTMVVPSDEQWAGGGRWFRCDLQQTDASFQVTSRKGSLSGALTGDDTLTLGCGTVKVTAAGDYDSFGSFVPCTESHDIEFAGIYTAEDTTYPSDSSTRSALQVSGCASVVATFINVPNDADLNYRTGYLYGAFTEEAWVLGNRSIGCYVWPETQFSHSVKSAGPTIFPVS